MSFWVYILKCSDKSYYTGHTDNLESRLYLHNHNTFDCYTSSRLPVILVFYEEFSSREEALERERQIKRWSRQKKEALIKGDWTKLSDLARGW
ncbi:MAG: GIY-YIG nuclease family protein [Gammaproteobacteria bacterium]|nr:GIY-YIG nuclease family protein [Gammaproteobacteria bacterium]MDH5594828.1 GIY-YIG nuclease family protein [Gammaproteobacteria bacterium]MDH5614310.1 GIY-YIG nuclease family protein [Gammaproteobacteria bacterium]